MKMPNSESTNILLSVSSGGKIVVYCAELVNNAIPPAVTFLFFAKTKQN